jgi:hypothetical protein
MVFYALLNHVVLVRVVVLESVDWVCGWCGGA